VNLFKGPITVEDIEAAEQQIAGVVKHTNLEYCERLSKKYRAKIYLKREDTQAVRSYKIRGAYNFMSLLSDKDKKAGIVCASAGNHAQGVALSAKKLRIKATIYMPVITPPQKINRVETLGGNWVTVQLVGRTFDETNNAAIDESKKRNRIFVPPFDDYKIIAGQGTIGKEIYDDLHGQVDVVVCPVGGGGLISGVSTYLKAKSKLINIIGVEPEGAAAMDLALKTGKVTPLRTIDTFVDGAAVVRVSNKTFLIVKKFVKRMFVVPVGKICMAMVELYQNEGIITEPAGALSVASLDLFADKLKGKVVVCIISGSNNDILRYPEIVEKSLIYQELRHYYLIDFPPKPGELRAFLDSVLGPTDDIIRFEYLKKAAIKDGAALVGIELTRKENLKPLLQRMKKMGLSYHSVNNDPLLYSHLI
jgi:threonine dehydratase